MKIVSSNNVNFPYKWIKIYSYEDIKNIPRNEDENHPFTVSCVCCFLPFNETTLRYPNVPNSFDADAPYKIGIFKFNFATNVWTDTKDKNINMPPCSVYFALPIDKQSSPNMSSHPDIKDPSANRTHRFPFPDQLEKTNHHFEIYSTQFSSYNFEDNSQLNVGFILEGVDSVYSLRTVTDSNQQIHTWTNNPTD